MDLRQLKKAIVSIVAEDPTVTFAYIFGSQVKGTAHANSDVDVAVHYNDIEPEPNGDIIAVNRQIELEIQLEKLLRKPVHVVVLNRASIDMRQNVLTHGHLLFCADTTMYAQFKITQLREHQDFIMMEPIFRRYRRKRIEEGTFGGRGDSPTFKPMSNNSRRTLNSKARCEYQKKRR